jgi:hypothetical protein
MRKFLKHLSVLFLTVFLVDKVALVAFDKLIQQSGIRYSRMQYDEYDIAVIGNSRGVNSVSEEIFQRSYDVNIINLSYNGLNKNEIFSLAGRVKDSITVYIECTSLLWDTDTSETESSSERIDVFRNLREEKFRIFQSSVFNHEIFLRSIYYYFSSDANWTNNGILSKAKLNFLTSKLEDNSKELNYRKDVFTRLYESLAKRGITTVFYVAPIRVEKVQEYKNWDLTLSEVKSDFPGFIDLSFSITDIESFADLVHSNKNEIEKLHKEIYEDFASRKLKPTNISADGF